MEKLKSAQMQLVEHAHAAGMAEVSSITLHNLGNIVNTVGVNLSFLKEELYNQYSLTSSGTGPAGCPPR